MINKYDHTITEGTYNDYLHKLKNQVFKLLPLREEGSEWEKWLETLLIETAGVGEILTDRVEFIRLLGKLEALKSLEEFHLYRKTIFESINIIDSMRV